jgi:glyoxylase-like metal-dependent hydrolase (beta-lactamase superfamily II)
MERLITGLVVGAVALVSTAAVARQAPPAPNYDAVQIKATDLGHRTWMLGGQGGNMTAIVGDDGVILVDTQFAPLHDKIKAAVGKLSDQPIRYVLNTHLHGDHTGGNQGFWLEGTPIVAHANLRKSMAEGTTNALSGAKTPPAPAAALPTRTYATASTTVTVKGRRAQMIHMPNAHTRGDSAVWIADANVLATGDIVSTGARYPNVDVGDGGDIDGLIAAVDAFIRRSNAETKVVPGHGALMTRADLVIYRALLADARAAVAKTKAAGMTEDQAVAAKPLAGDIQTRAGATDAASVNFVRLIYKSI